MSINKFIKNITLAVLAGSTIASCNKLDEKVFSQDSPDNFFGSKSDAEAALVGMYRPLQICCGGYEQAGTFILNSASDEGDAALFWGQFDDLTYTPNSTGEIGDLWRATYQSISSANFVIDNQEKIAAVDADFASKAIAEAKFTRAMNYFQLVQMFGGVPLRITQAKRADDVNIPRNTEDEVYNQIIEDLKAAKQDLPESYPAGKPTKWTAASWLAKVYITRKDYANALAEANDVIDNGPYTLQTTFASVFDVNNENNSEVIFAIQYIRKDQQGMRMQPLITGPNDKFASGATGGWGLGYVEEGFRNKYSPIDDRINTTFTSPDLRPGETNFYAGKWRDPEGVTADGHGTDFIVMRYADIVLIKAEAENELNGPSTNAYGAIDIVRDRAKLPGLTSGLTQDQFRDSVLLERHLELAYEEIRWFDLKRTGKLKEALEAVGKVWNDRYLYFPIPQTEVDASNGVITQNPGY